MQSASISQHLDVCVVFVINHILTRESVQNSHFSVLVYILTLLPNLLDVLVFTPGASQFSINHVFAANRVFLFLYCLCQTCQD